jgi:TPR repeat protein
MPGRKRKTGENIVGHRKSHERENKKSRVELIAEYHLKLGRLLSQFNNTAHLDINVKMLELAACDNAKAQWFVASCYRYGRGLNVNVKQAFLWARKAARQDYTQAQYYLGYCYETGCGITRKLHRALYWYRKASEENNVGAIKSLARCYRFGIGVDKNDTLTFKWHSVLAKIGDVSEIMRIAYMYLSGDGVKKKHGFALSCCESAAKKGDKHAQNIYGVLLYHGVGTQEADQSLGLEWLFKSAQKKNATAMCNIALHYELKKEDAKSKKWLNKARGYGENILLHKAMAYESGFFYEKDLASALVCYRQLCKDGDLTVKDKIKELRVKIDEQGKGAIDHFSVAVKPEIVINETPSVFRLSM